VFGHGKSIQSRRRFEKFRWRKLRFGCAFSR
jgi:hypothetical protein